MCCGTEAGSYLRLNDSCITQLKAQGPSRTCNESNEEEEEEEEDLSKQSFLVGQSLSTYEALKVLHLQYHMPFSFSGSGLQGHLAHEKLLTP